MAFERGSERGFFGVSALLFVASAALTIVWCSSMSAMGQVSMPGGWTMSTVWMRMPGQTWSGVAASFLGMWIVMMVAMMLPSIAPMLRRYRHAVGETATAHLGWLTALVGFGYFFVWIAFGSAVFPIGAALSAIAMRQPEFARTVPILVPGMLLIAGALHLGTSSSRHHVRWRGGLMRDRILRHDSDTAWRYGVRLGLDCAQRCTGLMIVLLVVGIMDFRVMAAVTAAITAERLAPSRVRVAQAISAVTIGTGLLLTARAIGLG